MTKPQLIIFDLDGTLMNTLGDITACLNAALSECGYPTHDSAIEFINNGARRLIADALPPDVRTDETIDNVLAVYRDYYSACTNDLTFPYEGTVEMVHKLKKAKLKLALFSNKDHEHVMRLMNRDFPGLFDCIGGISPDVLPKPNPGGIDKILFSTQCQKNKTLYVGDSRVDILTARNAGLTMYGVNWGFKGNEPFISDPQLPTVDTPAQLTKRILHLCNE